MRKFFSRKKPVEEIRLKEGEFVLRNDGVSHIRFLSQSEEEKSQSFYDSIPEPKQQDFPSTAVEWLDDPDHEFDVVVDTEAAQSAVDDAQAVRDLVPQTERPSITDLEGSQWSFWRVDGILYVSGEDGEVQAQFNADSLWNYLMTLKESGVL